MKKALIVLFLTLSSLVSARTYTKSKVPTLALNENNHVLIRGTVNTKSMSKAIEDLYKISARIPNSSPIYVILDSGGGSIVAGMTFLDAIAAIPQPVHTISMFSFSMAYSIAQRGIKRYILPHGITGQHRAKGTFSGQFASGEVESQLAFWTSIIKESVEYEASRMSISPEEFEKRIKDEMWLFGKNAVKEKAMDGLLNISCSAKLKNKRIKYTVDTFFGPISYTQSACPLLKGYKIVK